MDGAMNEREQGDFEALERIARGRRSVRGFLSDPVPMSIQRRALELALSAPSNCNVQPWLVPVVSGKPLARIRHAFVEAVSAGIAAEPDFPGLLTYPGIYRDRQVDSARQLYAAMGIDLPPGSPSIITRVQRLNTMAPTMSGAGHCCNHNARWPVFGGHRLGCRTVPR